MYSLGVGNIHFRSESKDLKPKYFEDNPTIGSISSLRKKNLTRKLIQNRKRNYGNTDPSAATMPFIYCATSSSPKPQDPGID